MSDIVKLVEEALEKTARWPAGAAGGKGGQFQGGKGDTAVTRTGGQLVRVTSTPSMRSSKLTATTVDGRKMTLSREHLLDPRSREAARAQISGARTDMRMARLTGDTKGVAEAYRRGKVALAEARSNRAEARSAFHEDRGYKLSNAAYAERMAGNTSRAERLGRLAQRSMNRATSHGDAASSWSTESRARSRALSTLRASPSSPKRSLTQRQRAHLNVDPSIRDGYKG